MPADKKQDITVVGLGYVGLSVSLLLAQKHRVTAFDLDRDKIALLRQGRSPISDPEIIDFIAKDNLAVTFTDQAEDVFLNRDFIVVATPTDYDPDTNQFDTSSIENVLEQVQEQASGSTVVIKSTVPVGYTKSLQKRFASLDIIFSPEFLREGSALKDNLYPSRIVLGSHSKKAGDFADLLKHCAWSDSPPVLFTEPTEAEAIKLFSNTFLAMRVSFFNELDSYCELNHLNTRHVIEGVCLDTRIGNHYNNPSFGYGGYCLPKDTKQLLANYQDVPNNLIKAIVDSNNTRKDFIVDSVMKNHPKVVGVYRLVMKMNSDNFRSSAIIDVIEKLLQRSVNVVLFEPLMKESLIDGVTLVNDLNEFRAQADLILANRIFPELESVKEKVYTRDVFSRD